ncbi:MAG TPA: PCYCGC motif-containing (lipo)protein, partial [Burkholderiales bacterium]|nr:PCYCGC motif-containing (lipo)protein [Burkholderiales bacterium]
MKRFQLPDPERRGFLRSVLASAVLVTGTAGLGMTMRANAQGTRASEWKVGMLRPDGLRIIPSGRSDASHVLDPNRFSRPEVRHAYWVATQIPATLNQLYCWCGCENRGAHRSNLQCFEDEMAVNCDVCRGTAEIAYTLVQKG